MLFDFGSDEEKVQQARHKLDSWRQAFRLDKKLQFKFDREEPSAQDAASAETPKAEKPKTEQPKAQKGKAKTAKTKSSEASTEPPAEPSGDVKLFVRLYFSAHEKLSEQRWIDRIPSEEPFKGAAPQVVHEGTPQFADVLRQFETLD
jgi:cell division protein FtsN